jgi:hypothetical protein
MTKPKYANPSILERVRIDPNICHAILVAVENDSKAGSGQFQANLVRRVR